MGRCYHATSNATMPPRALDECRRNVEAYALFNNATFELPMEIWEKPSGWVLGVAWIGWCCIVASQ